MENQPELSQIAKERENEIFFKLELFRTQNKYKNKVKIFLKDCICVPEKEIAMLKAVKSQ